MTLTNHKCRYSGDAFFTRPSIARLDVLAVCVTLQQFAPHRAIHTRAVCNIGQDIGVANIATFFEVGLEKRDNNRGLATFKPGPMD